MTCQVCGKEIQGQPHLWNDDPRLPMHPDIQSGDCAGLEKMGAFLNRNAAYINEQREPTII